MAEAVRSAARSATRSERRGEAAVAAAGSMAAAMTARIRLRCKRMARLSARSHSVRSRTAPGWPRVSGQLEVLVGVDGGDVHLRLLELARVVPVHRLPAGELVENPHARLA